MWEQAMQSRKEKWVSIKIQKAQNFKKNNIYFSWKLIYASNLRTLRPKQLLHLLATNLCLKFKDNSTSIRMISPSISKQSYWIMPLIFFFSNDISYWSTLIYIIQAKGPTDFDLLSWILIIFYIRFSFKFFSHQLLATR